MVLFYAAINLGFLTPYQSQVNQCIWVNAFFNISEQQKLLEQQKLFEQQKSNSNQEKPGQTKDEGIKSLRIPLDIPSDSTTGGNVLQANINLPKDSISTKDSAEAKNNVNLNSMQTGIPQANITLPKDSTSIKDSTTVKNAVNLKPVQSDIQQKSNSDSTKSLLNLSQKKSGQPKDSSRFSDTLAIRKTISGFKDSLGFRKDTTKIDSMAIDSTARLKYMR